MGNSLKKYNSLTINYIAFIKFVSDVLFHIINKIKLLEF